GLVEHALAIAEAAGIDHHARAPFVARVPALLVRPQAPAELRIELVQVRRGVVAQAERRLDEHERGKRRAAGGEPAPHGLPQRLAAISSAPSAWPASFQWPKPGLVLAKPCR